MKTQQQAEAEERLIFRGKYNGTYINPFKIPVGFTKPTIIKTIK